MATVDISNRLPRIWPIFSGRWKSYAPRHGLDFFPTIFEVVEADQLNEVAAYGGFPTRYPHWRFGMEYEQLSKGYDYGLQKIYELVINNNPCYAYLMKSNALIDQKLVMAHVYGHCDFFKNNYWFSQTNRKMMDQMANHGNRIRRHMDRFGVEEVEEVHRRLPEHRRPDRHPFAVHQAARRQASSPNSPRPTTTSTTRRRGRFAAKGYMDVHQSAGGAGGRGRTAAARAAARASNFPAEPVRDVMLFILEHAPLKPWQLDVLSIIRDEAYYFAPQGSDQDHERRLGQLLALHDHDPPGTRRRPT